MNAVSTLEAVKQHLVCLKMAAALEVLDSVLDQVERQQLSTLEALDCLLAEEYTRRETRRIRAQLLTSRLTRVKTLESFDFSAPRQPRPQSYPHPGRAQLHRPSPDRPPARPARGRQEPPGRGPGGRRRQGP